MAKRRALTELHVALTASTQKFTSKMNGARTNLSKFERAADRTKQTLGRMKPAFLAVGAAITAAGTATAFLVRQQFIAIDSLAKTADKLGLTTEALASLRFAAEQTGVATATLDMALQRMTRRIAEAAQGTGEARNAIRELGLDAVALNNMGPAAAFRQIAEAVRQVQNPADRLRLAFKLFDSEGAALVNTLSLGSAGLDKMADDAKNLGIAISRDAAARVEMANDALNRMRKAVVGVGSELAIQIAPTIRDIADAITPLLAGARTGLGEAQTRLGAISASIAYIKDLVTNIRIVGLGIAKSFMLVLEGMAHVFDGVVNLILRALDLIPGVRVELASFGTALDQLGQGIDKTVQELMEAPSAYQEMLHAQNLLRQQTEREREEREAIAKAAADQLRTMKETVALNRDLDPLLRSLRFATGMEPNVDGPPVPDGFDRRGRREEDFPGFAGPPRPDDPPDLRGGFSVVDSLANLARGGAAGVKDQTTQAVDRVNQQMADMLSLLSNGRLTVELSGVEV